MDDQIHGPGDAPEDRPPVDLGANRLLWIFAVGAIALLATLAAAPLRDQRTEWRAVQIRYDKQAAQVGVPLVTEGVKQIWRPELNVVDRCTSCHLGMGEAVPSPHERLFAAHPPVPHEPNEIGCTPCHAGQGRATSQQAAHGLVAHWEEPMLERPYLEAGCGTCHTHLPVAPTALASRGRGLFERDGCLDCHRVDRRGRGTGPDLSTIGLKGIPADWPERHMARAAQPGAGSSTSPWAAGFPAVTDDARRAIGVYLGTLVGAPRLYEGKALTFELGCRGCHKINGLGGDEGPALADVGRKIAGELDFSGVTGPRTLANWLTQHFLDPARVVPGSQMPAPRVSAEQAELLTVYMLSLRTPQLPESWTPRDRVRGALLHERDFPVDGAAIFGGFCAGCHGQRGSGRRFGTGGLAYPAVGSTEVLAVADDAFLRATIAKGRPGRKMPAWLRDDGLRREEIDAVVAYLRSLQPPARPFTALAGDPAVGRKTYARDCQLCHGARGEGTVLGSPLAAADNAGTSDARLIQDGIQLVWPGMGAYRGYDDATRAALATHVRGLRAVVPPGLSRKAWQPGSGSASRGEALFAAACAGCHGARGEGRDAPGIGTAAFLQVASDAFLRATIVRGRPTSGMPAFGSPSSGFRALAADEVADVVAFVRSFSVSMAAAEPAPAAGPPGAPPSTSPSGSP